MSTLLKKFIGLIIIAVAIAFVGFSGWRFIYTRFQSADHDKRIILQQHAKTAARLIRPELASMLTFTETDEGTPHFNYIREQLIAYSSNIDVRGIYTMALRDGDIVFGPESYDRDDPMASPPGIKYKHPAEQDLEIFSTGKEYVYGPNTDEYGTFITAIAPVKDMETGNVIMAVGIDIVAQKWHQEIAGFAKEPIIAFLALIFTFIAGIFLTALFKRRIRPGRYRLKVWIILPVSIAILFVVAIFSVHEYIQGVRLLSAEVKHVKALAESKWRALIEQQAQYIQVHINDIAKDPLLIKAWEDNDLDMLYKLSLPLHNKLKEDFKITHFYFIDDERKCVLRVHAPLRKWDIIDRHTMLVSEHTQQAYWGLEMGPLGTFTLRYVMPWRQENELFGYLELGMEIEHLKSELADFFDIDIVTVLDKKYTTFEKFQAGKNIFGFSGDWDSLKDFVVLNHTLKDLPEEINIMLERGYIPTADKIFTVKDNNRDLFWGVIPAYDISGREVAKLILIQDMTQSMAEVKSEILFNISIAFAIILGIIVLLWFITARVQAQLIDTFNKLHDIQENTSVTLNSIGDAVIATDTKGFITRMNPVAEQLTGWLFSEAKGKQLEYIFHIINANTRKAIPNLVTQVMEKQKPIGLANHTALISRNGKEYQIADSAAPIKAKEGHVIGVVIVFHDVTRQYHMQEELRLIQERLAIATRGTGIGIWDYHIHEDLLEWDDTMFKLFEVDKTAFKNKFQDFRQCIQPEALPYVEEEFQEAMDGKKEFDIEFPVMKPDGSIRYLAGLASFLRDEQGNPIRAVGINYDITERKESENILTRLSLAVEQSPACVVVTDTKGDMQYVNPKFTELTGYSAEEVIGKNPRVLKSGEQPPEYYKELWDTITAGRQWRGEFHNKKKNGQLYWESASISPIYNKEGIISSFVAVKEDITGFKEHQKKLYELALQYKTLVENVPGIVYRCAYDEDWTMSFISDEIQRLTGYPASDFIDNAVRPFNSIIHADDLGNVGQVIQKAVSEKKAYSLEYRINCSDGSYVWVQEKGRGVYGQDNNIIWLDGVIIDITYIKQAEEQLLESQKKYEQLARNSRTFHWEVDPNGLYTYLSPVVKDVTGYAPEELTGKKYFYDLCPEAEREKLKESAFAAMHKKEPFVSWENQIVSKDGQTLWVSSDGIPVLNKQGEYTGFRGSDSDITERKLAQEQIQHAIQMQMEFTSTVSHELRTPLTAIKEGIAIVLDGSAGEINEEQKDFLDTAKRNVNRLTRLINDVLDFQKLKAGKAQFNIEESDINVVISEAHKQMSPEAKKRGLDLILNLDKTIPNIRFDCDAIMRVLINIINNAFKFTDKGSVSLVSQNKPEENLIYVRVEDTGCGIKESDLPKLFEDFEQLEKGKDRKTGGTGLGLAISKKIMIQHGGRIWAESEPGRGTHLIFVLPIVERRGSRG
jgi:PAS domain S-box-containing protein